MLRHVFQQQGSKRFERLRVALRTANALLDEITSILTSVPTEPKRYEEAKQEMIKLLYPLADTITSFDVLAFRMWVVITHSQDRHELCSRLFKELDYASGIVGRMTSLLHKAEREAAICQ